MNFEDFKGPAKEWIQTRTRQLQESKSYTQIRERYEGLSDRTQKLIQYSLIFLFFLFLYSIPAGFLDSASEQMEFFSENRKLSQGIIKSLSSSPTSPSYSLPSSQLKMEVERVLTQQSILDNQAQISISNKKIPNSIAPSSFRKNVLKATINEINLQQAVILAEKLDEIKGSRLVNLSMMASDKDPHFFKVDYDLVSLSKSIKGGL